MKDIIYTKIDKENILEDFLMIPKKYKKYLQSNEEIYWIYEIFNIVNDKVYIGKTSDIRRRSLDYINNYCKGCSMTNIDKAINEIGIDKFIIAPLEVAFSAKSASIKELYYIDLLDSIDKGYNTILGSASYENRKVKKRKGSRQTIYARIAKSKLMCAIDPMNKKIVFSTGLKLFGDYICRKKDDIKSAAKRESKIEGYFIYYMNKTDFKSQIKSAELKVEKNSPYMDNKLQYVDFLKYSDYLLELLKDINENPENMEIMFITQSNDECGYKFSDLKFFMKQYGKTSDNLIN